jgi:hypothetical protein
MRCADSVGRMREIRENSAVMHEFVSNVGARPIYDAPPPG